MIGKTKDKTLAEHLAALIKIVQDAMALASRREEYSASYFARQASACQTILGGGWPIASISRMTSCGSWPSTCTSMCVSGSRFYGFQEWTRPTTKPSVDYAPAS